MVVSFTEKCKGKRAESLKYPSKKVQEEGGGDQVSPAAVPYSSSVPSSRTVECRDPVFSLPFGFPLYPWDHKAGNIIQIESSPFLVCY